VNRPLAAIAGALALALAVSACSTTNPDAATVNGAHLGRTAFEADLHALVSNTAFLKANEAAVAQGSPSVIGDTKGSISTAFAGQQLSNLVILELIRQELVTRKVVPDADQISRGEEVAQGILGVSDKTIWTALPANVRTKYGQKGADYLAMQKVLSPSTDAEVSKVFDSIKDQLEICASHILVATEADANTVVDELKQGKDFAEEAKARSIDPGSKDTGGSLVGQSGACPTGADLDPDFVKGARAATVGQPTAPIKSSFGYHIIRLDKPQPTLADLRDKLVTYGGQVATKAFISTSTQNATVSIDPHYGTWDKAKGTVVPTVAAGTAQPGPSSAPSVLATAPAAANGAAATTTP
jgi:parvulin-like peptidyl-prolyl isomerase